LAGDGSTGVTKPFEPTAVPVLPVVPELLLLEDAWLDDPLAAKTLGV
jgi:hypothetical protein